MRIELETEDDIVEWLHDFRFEDCSVFNKTMLQRVKRNTTVHGASIDITIAKFYRQRFRERAFAAGWVSVDGDGDAFH